MKIILGLVLAFTLFLPLSVQGQNNANRGKVANSRGSQSERPRTRPAFFTEDGKIDLSKLGDSMPAERVEAMKKADKNKDGFLDREEIQEAGLFNGMRMGPPGMGGQQQGGMPPFMSKAMTKDGKLDLAKLGNSMPAERVEAMKKADKNKDGFLDREEIQEAGLFNGMRMGPPGMGGPQQGGMPPFMSEAMTQDGKLDLAKLSKSVKNEKMLEFYKKADKNKDGFLDKDELKETMPPQLPGGNFGGPRGLWAEAMTEDGKLDLAKLPKGIDKDIQKKLKKADKDKDGLLNEEEIKSVASDVPGLGRMNGPGFGPENGPRGNWAAFILRRKFGNEAVTEDGRLDLSKLPKKMDNTMKRNLKKADKDKDGFLNQEELATQFPQMNRFNRRSGDNGPFGGDRGNRQRWGKEGQTEKQANSASLMESLGDARMENGSIDLSKLPSSVKSNMRNNMKAADFNKDGVLDNSEQKAIFPQLEK